MITIARITLVFLVLVSCDHEERATPQISGSNSTMLLRDAQTQRAGASATDCGDARPLGDDQKVNDCIVRSFESRRPFFARIWMQGFDSAVAKGVAMNRNGELYVYSFDSAPCGHPGCPPRLEEHRCPQPSIQRDAEGARLVCADPQFTTR